MGKQEILAEIARRANEVRGPYRLVLLDDVNRFAFEIAQQLNSSESERTGARKTVGTKIAELCLEIYPDVNWDSKFEDHML